MFLRIFMRNPEGERVQSFRVFVCGVFVSERVSFRVFVSERVQYLNCHDNSSVSSLESKLYELVVISIRQAGIKSWLLQVAHLGLWRSCLPLSSGCTLDCPVSFSKESCL